MSKHRGEPKPKYQITVMESELGWGQNFWEETFDTREDAQARIDEINSHNTTPVAPDYYIQADDTIKEIW